MSDTQDRQIEARMRYLPGQLQATYKKVEMLEREAESYGMAELIDKGFWRRGFLRPVKNKKSNP